MRQVFGLKTCLKAQMHSSNESTTMATSGQDPKNISNGGSHKDLPRVDIFLNPERREEVAVISTQKKVIAKTYFDNSDMKQLYPKLFQILWESTLPCFPGLIVSNKTFALLREVIK